MYVCMCAEPTHLLLSSCVEVMHLIAVSCVNMALLSEKYKSKAFLIFIFKYYVADLVCCKLLARIGKNKL